jgi:hypothetical protein
MASVENIQWLLNRMYGYKADAEAKEQQSRLALIDKTISLLKANLSAARGNDD